VKEEFLKYISKNKLFEKKDKILVAISGGLDSVVLLDLLFKSGFKISVAHCNFQLRGKESDMDEEFVKELSKKYKIECFIKICNAADYAKIKKLSIQESARELRYKWFEQILIENKFNKLAVGHHFDDNLETFFINFSRGSGLSGLKGIPLINENIVRPLLYASRGEIEKYAEENNLKYREDSSNKSEKYLRNKLRHNLLPNFIEILGGSDETLKKSMSYLAEDELIFNQIMEQKRSEIIKENDGYLLIEKSKLLSLSPINTWVYYLLKPFGYSRAITDDISEGLKNDNNGKTYFSQSHRLITDRDKLFLNPISEMLDSQEYIIKQGAKEINQPIKLTFSIVENNVDFKIEKKTDIAYFDFDKLSFPLRLRRWKKGDRFHPFGMQGSKLLSDYFIDQKLSLPQKENLWLLVSKEEIIWVVGMRTSDLFKLDAGNKKVLSINFRKNS